MPATERIGDAPRTVDHLHRHLADAVIGEAGFGPRNGQSADELVVGAEHRTGNRGAIRVTLPVGNRDAVARASSYLSPRCVPSKARMTVPAAPRSSGSSAPAL